MKLKKIAKWTAAAIAAVAVLAVAAVAAVVWILTPGRLTPLVRHYASEMIDGHIDVKRVELTFWSTFPRLTVEADSLAVVANSFDRLTPAQLDSLPPGAERLFSVEAFRGGIDLVAMLRGELRLYDIELRRPELHLVEYDPSTCNYMIAKPSEPDSAGPSAGLPFRKIALDHFRLTGPTPVRYFSRPDSIDVEISLTATELHSHASQPEYRISVEGTTRGHVPDILRLDDVAFGLNGEVRWDVASPYQVTVSGMALNLGNVGATVSGRLDLADSITVSDVDIHAKSVKITDIIDLAGRTTAMHLPDITTDLAMDLRVKSVGAYNLSATPAPMPTLHAELSIPKGRISYGRMRLKNVALKASAEIPAGDLNRARIDIDELRAEGRSMGFRLEATVDALGNISDPQIKGTFRGGIELGNLPEALMQRLRCSLAGSLVGNADFSFRPSDFRRIDLNALRLDGDITLHRFRLLTADSLASAYIDRAKLKFGANTRLQRAEFVIDSMATASLNVDSIAYEADGIRFAGSHLKFGAGLRHADRRPQAGRIAPIGISASGRMLTLTSAADSLRLRLRDLDARATLTRFEGNARRPRLAIDVSARRMGYADRLNRANLREAAVTLELHPRKRPRLGKRASAVYDSLLQAHPDLRLDSVYALTRLELRRQRGLRQAGLSAADSAMRADSLARRRAEFEAGHQADIDFGLDNSLRTWLRLWEVRGKLKAARGRAFTPFFPIRNRLDSVDIAFNTDSLTITGVRYSSGPTSAVINGHITNITPALTSRRGAPVGINVDLRFDTLDINAFAGAIFAGSAFAARRDSVASALGDSDADDETLQEAVAEAAPADSRQAFIVPSNVEAALNLTAAHVRYSDIWLDNVEGRIGMSGGAVHLDRFYGHADMGTVDLTALYRAPDANQISLATGMLVSRLDLKKLLHLLPEVDSLLPLLNHIEGIVTADLAMTTELDSLLDFRLNTLRAAMKLSGDSLVALDNATFRKLSKWLIFKNKQRNMIDHMEVELMVRDSRLDFMPFQFDIDRYRLGVWGGNTLDMRYDYHIAVLKSPIPFKFGINIRGQGEDFKVRLGKAKFNPDNIVSQRQLTDTVRVNLINEIRRMFERGVKSGQSDAVTDELLKLSAPSATERQMQDSVLTRADSVMLMQQGILEMSPAVADSIAAAANPKLKHHKKQ